MLTRSKSKLIESFKFKIFLSNKTEDIFQHIEILAECDENNTDHKEYFVEDIVTVFKSKHVCA